MQTLTDRMGDDMRLRGFARTTQLAYRGAVVRLAAHFARVPDTLDRLTEAELLVPKPQRLFNHDGLTGTRRANHSSPPQIRDRWRAGCHNGDTDTSPRRSVRGTGSSRRRWRKARRLPCGSSLRGKDALTLSRALLAMSQKEFSATFKGSPMTCAKSQGCSATPPWSSATSARRTTRRR